MLADVFDAPLFLEFVVEALALCPHFFLSLVVLGHTQLELRLNQLGGSLNGENWISQVVHNHIC